MTAGCRSKIQCICILVPMGFRLFPGCVSVKNGFIQHPVIIQSKIRLKNRVSSMKCSRICQLVHAADGGRIRARQESDTFLSISMLENMRQKGGTRSSLKAASV